MQVPTRRIFLQRLNQRLCHRIAHDRHDVDAVAHGDVPDVLRVEGLFVVHNDAETAKQINQSGPHGSAMHHRRYGKHTQLRAVRHHHGKLLRRLDWALTECYAAAAERCHKDGFVRPDHAFRHARCAAGAQNVVVVFAAIRIDKRFVTAGKQGFISFISAANRQSQLHIGRLRQCFLHFSFKVSAVNQSLHIQVGVEVFQFLSHIAVIHIDRHCADFHAGEKGL